MDSHDPNNTAPAPADPPAPAPPPARRRRRWLRRVGITLLALVLTAFAAHALWYWHATSRLAQQIDTYRAAGEPVTPEDLNPPPVPVPPEANAVPDLRAIADGIDTQTEQWRDFRSMDLRLPLTDADSNAVERIAATVPDLEQRMESALAKGGVDWELQFRTPMMVTIDSVGDDLNAQHELGRLLYGAGLMAHRRGDHDRCLRYAEYLMFVSRAVNRQPILVAHLAAQGMAARAAGLVVQASPDLMVANAPNAEDAARRGPPGPASAGPARRDRALEVIRQLLDDRPSREAQRRMWLGERVMQVDTATALARGDNDQFTPPRSVPAPRVPAVAYLLRPALLDNGREMARYTTALSAAAEAPDRPAFRAAAPPEPRKATLGRWRYFLADMLLPTLDRVAERYYYTAAERRLAATCLAARLYALDHDGRLPTTLQDLVPRYLPAVPSDPMAADSRPLGYVNAQTDPARPRVYSVGDNGIDQGGNEPSPRLSRKEYIRLADEVRHLRRQPRDTPTTDEADQRDAK